MVWGKVAELLPWVIETNTVLFGVIRPRIPRYLLALCAENLLSFTLSDPF